MPARLRRVAEALLPERWRSTLGLILSLVIAVPMVAVLARGDGLSQVDASILVLLIYLVTYVLVTAAAFSIADIEQVRAWAVRPGERGSVMQRYVYGTAPGPGVSIFIAGVALVGAVVWLPGYADTAIDDRSRVAVAVVLVAVSWVNVVVSFAVAFHADDLLEDQTALEFPGDTPAQWSDYIYFAVAVMTTFGATDVTVVSPSMRRTVTVNGIIAFVFNTVIVAALVSALTTLG